ncbi:asparagine synthase (glutamine-hydrolyzing) [Streptomyces sp. LP05-1]|uniref:asparagine synthase (glutamine-hydrolyzing) n=1 Tax=Streptomyces pyxinae TaxID=2970734 RepID=A0ABT2CH03_9ACTN|nr:asparagine synthase (glutamine-hydrolyzing) [Streptomyces sp. LP05-1]MCS0636688.1 asparagine synthase (glutamine-hydrolyzing) [Streptomyces sp. LP05-1]
MCGITGWVDHEQDLTTPAARAALTTMTATLAGRGPDAEGLWTGPHAALGHRRLVVIDPPGGGQPKSATENGRTLAVLVHSGEVYNYRELRYELQGRGHRFESAGDTEVVLRAYLEWGPAFATRLNGMYALAVWDARSERLLLVRDRLGVKPLYYHPTGTGVLFASEPKALLAHPAVDAAVGTDGLRELLSLTGTPGHAVYSGMREVRPGHVLTAGRQGISESRYWQLRAHEHTDDLKTTVSTVRGMLETVLARQTVADVPLCSLLSGGLDSSAITALAARRPGRARLRSFSVAFDHHERDFTPDLMHVESDRPYARALAGHVGTDHTDIALATPGLMNQANRRAALHARDLPSGLGDFDISALLLFRAVRAHATVALSGEGADELFGGYFWFHDPRTARADTFPWLAAMDVYTQAGLGDAPLSTRLLDPALVGALDLPAYRRDRYRQALAGVAHPGRTDALEHRMREVGHLHLTRFLPLLLDRKDRMSMATGLEVRVPFCDHELVQYVFGAPWSMKTSDGREKSLLRAAVADLLPEAVLRRPKNPYPTVRDPRYTRALRTALTELAHDRAAPVHTVLDRAAVRRALAPGTDAKDMRYAAELVLDLNTWLTDYRVRLDLS